MWRTLPALEQAATLVLPAYVSPTELRAAQLHHDACPGDPLAHVVACCVVGGQCAAKGHDLTTVPETLAAAAVAAQAAVRDVRRAALRPLHALVAPAPDSPQGQWRKALVTMAVGLALDATMALADHEREPALQKALDAGDAPSVERHVQVVQARAALGTAGQ